MTQINVNVKQKENNCQLSQNSRKLFLNSRIDLHMTMRVNFAETNLVIWKQIIRPSKLHYFYQVSLFCIGN